jgi:hypothetical protein
MIIYIIMIIVMIITLKILHNFLPFSKFYKLDPF